MLISWPDLCVLPLAEPEWLVNPYVFKEGITFLWGRSNVGKSPLVWALSRSVGEGSTFFGLPASRGRVLFVELDTPLPGVTHRLKIGKPSAGVSFLFLKPLSVPAITGEEQAALAEAQEKVSPDMVVINTLRKCHSMDDKDSRTSKEVYGFWQHKFPRAALVFVHHPKKRPTQADAVKHITEDFSGTNAFFNDAQVALKLEPYRKRKDTNLRLLHVKAQASKKVGPMHLQLDPADGTTLTVPRAGELQVAHAIWLANQGETDASLERMGVAKRDLDLIRQGAFPGIDWLGSAEEEEE